MPYASLEDRSAWSKRYYARNPEAVKAIKRAWEQRNPEKRRAQIAVGNAVRDGRLVKGACERAAEGTCKGRIEAHHEDYEKPLEVRWFCSHHHADHRRRG